MISYLPKGLEWISVWDRLPEDFGRYLVFNECVYIASFDGKGTAEWLSCEDNFYTLKQQFPTTDDIKAEIARYRKLIRESKDL